MLTKIRLRGTVFPMPYTLKITKKGANRYAQIIQVRYDKNLHKSISRSYQSFGNLTKKLILDPEYENRLREQVKALNEQEKLLKGQFKE